MGSTSRSTHGFVVGQNGRQMPAIGFGTWQPESQPASIVKDAVINALKLGYRHIDTALLYGDGLSEQAVGDALREWGGSRGEVWITSKLYAATEGSRTKRLLTASAQTSTIIQMMW